VRIVVDSNVLVSASFWNGDSERIIALAESKKLELFLSKEIIDEFIRVLGYEDIKRKIKDKGLEMKRTVEKIEAISTIIEPKIKIKAVIDDPSDDKFIECAVEARADYLISKDKHLLKMKSFIDIDIITPKEFLKKLAANN
jgi:uncharacterized protein